MREERPLELESYSVLEDARGRAPVAEPLARFGSRIAVWGRANWLTAILLLSITVFALAVRLENVNWDRGQHLHPDERFVSIVSSDIRLPSSLGEYFDSAASPLNPYNHTGSYVYGTFPLFLNKALTEWLAPNGDGSTAPGSGIVRGFISNVLQVDLKNPDGTYAFDAAYNSNIIGRVLSALADVATVLLAFELGRVLWGRRVGLLAAALLAATPLHIQYSHFFGSETFLAFFITATIYFSVRIWKYGGPINYAMAGLMVGLTIASKLSGLPVLLVPALAVLVRIWPEVRTILLRLWQALAWWRPLRTYPRVRWDDLLGPVAGALGLLVVAGVVFRIAQPYAFDGPGFFDVFRWDLNLREDVFSFHAIRHLEFLKPVHYFAFSETFLNDIDGLLALQSGADFPPNLQWIGRTKYLFPLSNIALWGMGLPLFLAAAGGIVYSVWRIFGKKDLSPLLLVAWVLFFFWFIARGFTPTMRYFLPIYPAMVVLAAFGLVSLWSFARSDRPRVVAGRYWRRAQPWAAPALRALVVAACAGTFLWGIAFLNVYRQDHSRVQATYWIAENVPPGSVLTSNEWDDGLPLALPGSNFDQYRGISLKPFLPDNAEKVAEFVNGLAMADYVVESSNRVYDSIPRLPQRFPSMLLYYQYLEDGSLGFEKVAEFTNYPRLFGIDIPDQGRSEEAFSVYDHPKVTIWRKTEAFSRERALELLRPERGGSAVSVTPGRAASNGQMLTPEEYAEQQAGGTWSDLFGVKTGTGAFSPGNIIRDNPTIAWFIALQLFALAALPLSLLLLRALPDHGYGLSKPLGLMVVGFPIWFGASVGWWDFTGKAVVIWTGLLLLVAAAAGVWWRREVLAFVKERWRLILLTEALFLAVFVAFWGLRVANPDLWHQWRGGEKHMELAYLQAVTKSTSFPPYDPWFAGGFLNYYYYGWYFVAIISKPLGIAPEMAFNLAVPMFAALTAVAAFSLAHNLAAASIARRRGDARVFSVGPALAGLSAAVLVLGVGNLGAANLWMDRLRAVDTWQVAQSIPVVNAVFGTLGGLWNWLVHGAVLSPFDYWAPSRIIPESFSITEFPFFTFLFADLHPHLMVIPFAITAASVSFALVMSASNRRPLLVRVGVLLLMGLLIGSMRAINAWDFPTQLILGVAAVVAAAYFAAGRFGWRFLLTGLAYLGVLGVAVYAFFLPFTSNYQTFERGIDWTVEQTPIQYYFLQFGLFLVLAIGLIGARLPIALRGSVWHRTARLARRRPLPYLARRLARRAPGAAAAWVVTAVFLASLPLFGVGAFVLGYGTLFVLLVAALLLVSMWVLEVRRGSGAGLLGAYCLLFLALAITAGTEIVRLSDDLDRMNTVFKFWLQAWWLYAIAGGYAIWHVGSLVRRNLPDARLSRGRVVFTALWGLASVVLFLGTVLYPLGAVPQRAGERFVDVPRTLDGAAFMAIATYVDERGEYDLSKDYRAILWARENIEGSPTIIEGLTPLYRWGNRFAVYTGLPAVVGWDWHQQQQRWDYGQDVLRRRQDVETFYQTAEVGQALRILQRYDVRYIFVGETERAYYPAEGIAKFGSIPGTRLVYDQDGVQIYEVDQDAVAGEIARLLAAAPQLSAP